ncbi:MAG TPA: hypothetical protein VL856_14860, partial [Acidimicrobiia bacterium]|nr:hypothetical protein [Acidimicrobiia bacterium]
MVEIVRQRSRRWVGLLLLIVVVSSAIVIGLVVAHSKPKPTGPPFDLRTVGTPCHNDSAWVCGSIRVPLDRASQSTGSVRVRFRVLPRRLRAKESAGTIVVVAGGPGAPAMPQYSA